MLEEKQREEILREMRKLRDDIVGLLGRFNEDPALKLNVQQAWKSAV